MILRNWKVAYAMHCSHVNKPFLTLYLSFHPSKLGNVVEWRSSFVYDQKLFILFIEQLPAISITKPNNHFLLAFLAQLRISGRFIALKLRTALKNLSNVEIFSILRSNSKNITGPTDRCNQLSMRKFIFRNN